MKKPTGRGPWAWRTVWRSFLTSLTFQPLSGRRYLALAHGLEAAHVPLDLVRQAEPLIPPPSAVRACGLVLEALPVNDLPVLHQLDEQGLSLGGFAGVGDHQRFPIAVNAQI